MSIVTLRGMNKSFGKTVALDGVDLELKEGEVLGFIGPNGAGKTTTIRILLGSIKGDGFAEIFGLDPWKDAVEIHKNLSYVPGDVNLWPNLTGGEVIDLFMKLKGQKNYKLRDELIEKFDFDPKKKCRTYSKGNRQKVALIAALASDVDLYLFDEPTSGLDPLMESLFQKEVQNIQSRGKTVLLSSHILSEVEKICDTVSIIRQGKIIETGKISDIKHLTMSKIKVETRNKIPEFNTNPLIQDYKEKDGVMEFNVVSDNLNEVMAILSKYGIINLESQHPSLEELFMTHYEKRE